MWPIIVVATLLGAGLLYSSSSKKSTVAAKKPPPPLAPAAPPPTALPVLDASLQPQEKTAVQKALTSTTASPSDLIQFATALKPTAPQAASQLQTKAQALSTSSTKSAKGAQG